jgi:hypothetical protein
MASRATHREGEVTENIPDTIIKIKKEKTCIPMDVAILEDRNVRKSKHQIK